MGNLPMDERAGHEATGHIEIQYPILPMSFLKDYMTFASDNEAPEVYHKWAALSALSSIISRQVWVDQGIFTIYPNIYVVLVGDAGGRKSTAMSLARRLIRELRNRYIAPDSITKEKLARNMSEAESPCIKRVKVTVDGKDHIETFSHCCIYADELITLLEAGGNPMGMIAFLTNTWSVPEYEVETKGAGNDYITAPYITICGCMTTDTMSNLMNTKIISSGFARRCMFVYSEDEGNPVPRPGVSHEQNLAWDRCIARAKEIQKLKGPFAWEPAAEVFWDNWYTNCFELRKNAPNKFWKSWYLSKPSYLLKIAMLVTVSDSDQLILTEAVLRLALAFIDEVEPLMEVAFAGAGRNEMSPIASAIEQLVNNSDHPIPIKKIYMTFWKDAPPEEIQKILNYLNSVDKVKFFKITKNKIVQELVGQPGYSLTAGQPEQPPADEA